jgi:hypothetical protein
MKKIFVFISLIIMMGCCSPVLAYNPTQQICSNQGTQSTVCQQQGKNSNPLTGKGGVLKTVLDILSVVIGVISVFMVVIGALSYIMSSGDSQRTNTAKNTILYALIGLAVVAAAQSIVLLVSGKI